MSVVIKRTGTVIVTLLAAITVLLAAVPASAQDDPSTASPRPGAIGEPPEPLTSTRVYDTANLLNDDQEAWIEADATRLARFDLPTVVLVQILTLGENEAAAYAADVRRQWGVETTPGADDGLVMLITIDPNATSLLTTMSWGDNALPHNGIDEALASTIETEWLSAYVGNGELYEGILYTLRKLIYYSIYTPAPIPPASTAQSIVHVGISLLGPALAIAFGWMMVQWWRKRTHNQTDASPIIAWGPPLAALGVAVPAVWSRSEVGVASALALLAITAAVWVLRDPRRSASSTQRHEATKRSRFSWWMLIPVGLFTLSLVMNLNDVPTTEFHPDETRWVNRANYFSDLADPFGPTWEDQYLTRGQPPLGSYLMGLGLVLQGRDTDTNGVWDFAYGTDWNTISGAMTSTDDLHTARRANAVVAATTVVLVFFIGRAISGNIAGTVGGLLLALHPLHVWIGSQALSDQLLNLLVASTLLVAIHLARSPARGKALALGILLGLGGATKLSPLLLSLPIAIYGIALLILANRNLVDRPRASRLGPLLIVQPIIAVITFIVSYPYLWPAPIIRTVNLFQLRAQEMESQASAWPNVSIEHPGVALLRIHDRLAWQFSTFGEFAESLLARIGYEGEVWGVELAFAVVGIGALAWLVIQRGLTSGTALFAYVLAGQIGAIVVGMQVDFYRYHLPVALGVTILAGIGAVAIRDIVVSIAQHADRDSQAAPSRFDRPISTGSQ